MVFEKNPEIYCFLLQCIMNNKVFYFDLSLYFGSMYGLRQGNLLSWKSSKAETFHSLDNELVLCLLLY